MDTTVDVEVSMMVLVHVDVWREVIKVLRKEKFVKSAKDLIVFHALGGFPLTM